MQNEYKKKGFSSIFVQHLPFMLATSVANHHSHLMKRLEQFEPILDYLNLDDPSTIHELRAGFKLAFRQFALVPFIDEISRKIEEIFHDESLAKMLAAFSAEMGKKFTSIKASDSSSPDFFKKLLEKMKESSKAAINDVNTRPSLFFLTGHITSILDNLDTWEAMTGRTRIDAIKTIPFDIKRTARRAGDIIPSFIQRVRKDSPLDPYRDHFFKVIRSFADNLQPDDVTRNRGKIYSVTAPCGIGKTLGILYLALSLQSLSKTKLGHVPKIIYSLPFISICDQVEDVVKDLLGLRGSGQSLAVTTHHHLADFGISTKKLLDAADSQDSADAETEESEHQITDYEIDLWRSDIVITSSVRLFETMFRYTKNNLLRFNRLVNSIVIIDEYHSIPLKYHDLIHAAMLVLSRHFNTQFIVATATTPAIFEPREVIEIIPDQAALFGGINRYTIAYSQEVMQESDFKQRIFPAVVSSEHQHESIMIVVNTTRRSRQTYFFLKTAMSGSMRPVYHLSGKMVPDDRKEQLKKIRADLDAKNAPILITTQIIEAGIDVSFDYIIRDIGPLSSIVQVAGRCNRNGQLEVLPRIDVINVENDANIYDAGAIQVTKNFFKKLNNIADEVCVRNHYIEYAKLLRENKNKNACKAYLDEIDFASMAREFKMIDEKEELNWMNMIVLPARSDLDHESETLASGSGIPRRLLGRTITLSRAETEHVIKAIQEDWNAGKENNARLLVRDPMDAKAIAVLKDSHGAIDKNNVA
nr:CRISPR-associated helicase Cas3' [Candidatus Sigynarchaeota archaeon]